MPLPNAGVIRCAPFGHVVSAAQNGRVTRICPQCGALLLTGGESCSFCDSVEEEEGAPRRTSRHSKASPGVDGSEWRQEVTRRLGEYRARTGRQPLPNTDGLTTREDSSGRSKKSATELRSPTRASAQVIHTERMDICIQPEFDFSSFPDDRAHPQTALVPVGSLSRRRSAGILDALFIASAATGFLMLFHTLGGQIAWAKLDFALYTAVVYLIYCQYFLLFTALGGATPGMQILGLSTVRLDGSAPSTRQMLWRGFGYMLSGATLLLGFCWAFWDEDHFTWHDRISHTYITAALPLEVDTRPAP